MANAPRNLLTLLVAALLPACGGGTGGAGTPSPAFFLVSSQPLDGTTTAPTDEPLRLTFNLGVDATTIGGPAIRVRRTATGAVVTGTAAVDPASSGRTVVWTPTEPFQDETQHAVTLAPSIRSFGGDALGGRLEILFRTGQGIHLPGPLDLRRTLFPLQRGRRSHTATLLTDGTVLVAGGFTLGTSVTDRAEVFAPTTERFTTLAAPMVHPRAAHTATRLADGRVLLAGGWYERSGIDLASSATAEVYDPATGGFTAVGDMTSERVDHAAYLLPDGRVLVTGGSRLVAGFLEDLDTAELFDPATGTFAALPQPMSHTRSTHGCVPGRPGKLVLAGGSDLDFAAEWFDVATLTFQPLVAGAADAARFGPQVASFASGGVSIAGGDEGASVMYVDAATGFVHNSGSPLSVPRSYGTATRYAPDRILVAGGADTRGGFFLLSTVDVILEGGPGGSGTFPTAMRFPEPMVLHTATLLTDGRILFCGGLNMDGGAAELDHAFLFTPPAD